MKKMPNTKQNVDPAQKKLVLGRLIRSLITEYKWSLLIVVVGIIVGAVGSISTSIFIQQLTDRVIMPALTQGFNAVKPQFVGLLIGIITLFIFGLFGSFVYTRIMAVVSQSFLKKIRVELFTKMQSLPIKYFDTHTHGDIMSTYTNDVDALRQLIGQSLPSLITTIITVVGIFTLMLVYSLWLTFIVIACIVIMLFLSKSIGGKSRKYFVKQQEELGKVEGYVEEIMHGQKVVQVFTHEEEIIKDFNEKNESLFNSARLANTFANIMMPIMMNMGNFMYVLIAFVGGALMLNDAINVSLTGIGTLSIGVVLSFLNMSKMFGMSIGQVAQQINAIVLAGAGAVRIYELLDQEKEVDDGYVTLVNAKIIEGEIVECEERTGFWAWRHPHKADNSVTYTPLKGDIELNDVDFSYTGEKLVLEGVSVFAHSGQKIAFVGATGAGKTTITNLLNRFYDIADGKIRYDGININKIKKDDLRRSLGMVLQDTNLFTGTVMENIRYGRLDATDEECISGAVLANAHDFITRLPEGYQTMLTEDGANLSQGQRQLLSIARASVKNAPVMIMDEATSSIDTRTESLVQEGTDKLMEGRTVFVIAHRLSTIHNADVIIVLDKGKIIEQGNHDDLILQKGKYYQLYTGDFELE